MAIKTIRIGNLFISEYDDAIDPVAIETDGVVKITRTPVDPEDAVRLTDITTGPTESEVKRLAFFM